MKELVASKAALRKEDGDEPTAAKSRHQKSKTGCSGEGRVSKPARLYRGVLSQLQKLVYYIKPVYYSRSSSTPTLRGDLRAC